MGRRQHRHRSRRPATGRSGHNRALQRSRTRSPPIHLGRFPPDESGGAVQQFVRVENPTPATNGTRRTYLLPLEGRFDTPTNAIGSTFGISPGAYKPTGQA